MSEELGEKEKWTIAEHLIESYYELGEMGYPRKQEHVEIILDKISPNWREADSCAEVETHEILVDESQKGDEK